VINRTNKFRSRLAVIGMAGAFAVSPLAIHAALSQTMDSNDPLRIIEEDGQVEENQLEPYSDKMGVEEPAPTAGDPVAAEDQVPADGNGIAQDGASPTEDRLVQEAPATAPADETLASEPDADGAGEGVDPMTSAAIPEDGGPDGVYLVEQGDHQILANEYIGKSVYNDADEKIGDIRDLVLSAEGGIEAVVIGVGGFLGLGEKQVAVRFDEIRVVEDPETAEIQLHMTGNADQLAEAPEFVSRQDRLAEIRADENAIDQPADPLAPSGVTTE
jgi:sporulation protein YlmC with PRC-barrel domain